ncbi:hypothetical protein CMV_009097 [Castanea mollissima]|uniref:Cleavage and polyadenylation specificity factor subunit 2 n=1 Tax=Castanea mollissima TaxID=60419 RepID=A0A8J4RLL8_9ROSI|nr:hypothetical protein CMV_009097 [Castanea mollissima]
MEVLLVRTGLFGCHVAESCLFAGICACVAFLIIAGTVAWAQLSSWHLVCGRLVHPPRSSRRVCTRRHNSPRQLCGNIGLAQTVVFWTSPKTGGLAVQCGISHGGVCNEEVKQGGACTKCWLPEFVPESKALGYLSVPGCMHNFVPGLTYLRHLSLSFLPMWLSLLGFISPPSLLRGSRFVYGGCSSLMDGPHVSHRPQVARYLGGWFDEGLPVHVKCSLIYMDFEGRSDGRSIKSILSQVAPLKLVLVHGSAEATEHLKQHCLKHVCPHVYAPHIEETIDVTSDLCAYKVQLSEKLMSNVLFKKLGDYEIAWVDAEVGKTDSGMLSLLPCSNAAPLHKSVLVGDLKMADFKQFLASKGVQVEFAGGALRCGEYVTIRKVGDASQKGGGSGLQQILIEGPLCEDYYKIRDYLYSQFFLL